MGFQRPKRSGAEIALLPPLGTTEWESHARATGPEWAAETLVHVIRQAAMVTNTGLIESLGFMLTGLPLSGGLWGLSHCEPIIGAVARRHQLYRDSQVLHEFREKCHAVMWKAILAGWEQKPYWELCFGLVLKSACIDEARKLGREYRRLLPLQDDLLIDVNVASPHDEAWQRIVEDEVEAAILRRLPPTEARVAHLSLIERLPVDSKDGPSIAKVLGITPRWAYELHRRAQTCLSEDPQLRRLRSHDSD